MAVLTKIYKNHIGDFTISFSIKTGTFNISMPKDVTIHASTRTEALLTWEDVLNEINRISDEHLLGVNFTRRVIIIQLQTSESKFKIPKAELQNDLRTRITKDVVSDDYLTDGTGFIIRWYIADEFRVGRGELKYKITDHHKNIRHINTSFNILPQLLYGSNGEMRVLTYRKDLHEWLVDLENKLSDFLSKLVSFFDIDTTKFLDNFNKTQLQLPDITEK